MSRACRNFGDVLTAARSVTTVVTGSGGLVRKVPDLA